VLQQALQESIRSSNERKSSSADAMALPSRDRQVLLEARRRMMEYGQQWALLLWRLDVKVWKLVRFGKAMDLYYSTRNTQWPLL
jgi:hypothetical protein